MFKEKLEDYTEDEMLNYLIELFKNPKRLKGRDLEKYTRKLADHIVDITEHPERNDLIFYPPADREDSPEGILNEIKRWRKSQGLPLFKDSK